MSSDLPPSRRTLFWSLQLGGWLAFATAMALSRVTSYPLDYMVATKSVLAASGLAVSLGLRAIYLRVLRDDDTHVRLLGITVTTSYVAALVWTAFYNVADASIAGALLGRSITVTTVSQLTSGSVYHAFALLAWSILYVATKRHFALELERARASKAEALAQQATLQALRLQLQPHFLFNTLNALSTLIVEQRTAEASRMVSRIADFLRLTLAEDTRDRIPLEEEVEHVARYLDIEQVRFGDRLTVEANVQTDVRQALVPPLLLQPVMENAIRHGVALDERDGRITIDSRLVGVRVRIDVTNTGCPADVASNGTGVGLANIRARLETMYDDRQELTMHPLPDGGMRVSIEIPFELREQ